MPRIKHMHKDECRQQSELVTNERRHQSELVLAPIYNKEMQLMNNKDIVAYNICNG